MGSANDKPGIFGIKYIWAQQMINLFYLMKN
jgi:hypothetical protein